jgi:cyclase
MRVIPALLIRGNIAYKGVKFNNYKYLGDPINIIRIFNDKQVDEMTLLDIGNNSLINYEFIKKISNEAFFPISYGGGIDSLKKIEQVLYCGYERVIINSHHYLDDSFLQKAIREFGSSTIIVAVDVKKSLLGKYRIYTNSGTNKLNKNLDEVLVDLDKKGVSEIIINSIDYDGTKRGYDYDLIKLVDKYLLNTNFMISGGSRGLPDFEICKKENIVSACIAGSCFVFQGKHNSVLINYSI